MSTIQIGCGQITWAALNWQNPDNPPYTPDQMLTDIAQAGYAGAPAGPRAGVTTEKKAKAFGEFNRAAGVGEVYVAAGGFDDYVTTRGLTRRQASGNVRPEDAMTDAEFEQFAKVLTRVGEITLEYGVKSCFHNHVASTIETGEEIDRLFSMVDRDVVFMGPDTGHLEWDYAEFSKAGIWTELGHGCIDFPALFTLLGDAGFGTDDGGWVIVETDVTQLATPLESAIVSREYLKGVLG